MESKPPSAASTWGDSRVVPDTRTLRRIRELLESLGDVGEYTTIVLVFLVAGMLLLVLTQKDFETPIFDDGTSRACVLDAATGEARYVE